MKLLAHVHRYVPEHGAGAEWMLHSMLTDLAGRGHEVQVLCSRGPQRGDVVDGIPVGWAADRPNMNDAYDWCDVAITHLDMTSTAMMQTRPAARRKAKPLVHVVHNHLQLKANHVTPQQAQLVVWNSEWIAERCKRWRGPSMILHPPIDPARYRVPPTGDAVVMMNLSMAKGAQMFWQLCGAFPDTPFIGVRGAYGMQLDLSRQHRNAEVVANRGNVRDIYARAKVVLMPSHYESWGRVAVEASCSGIPSLVADTPGLREAGVGHAVLAHDDFDAWRSALGQLLTDDVTWKAASVATSTRFGELQHKIDGQLDELEHRLIELA